MLVTVVLYWRPTHKMPHSCSGQSQCHWERKLLTDPGSNKSHRCLSMICVVVLATHSYIGLSLVPVEWLYMIRIYEMAKLVNLGWECLNCKWGIKLLCKSSAHSLTKQHFFVCLAWDILFHLNESPPWRHSPSFTPRCSLIIINLWVTFLLWSNTTSCFLLWQFSCATFR